MIGTFKKELSNNLEFDELPHEIQVMILLISCYIQCLLIQLKNKCKAVKHEDAL
tara:strand:+ start:229 stop:390 length:162 start_codon:yes stop_codon:yes gene_type:complete